MPPARLARSRYSPTFVRPTLRLAAILRSDKPSALSRSTSLILALKVIFSWPSPLPPVERREVDLIQITQRY